MSDFLSAFLAFTVIGLVIGSAYAIAASGLVITYATSNVSDSARVNFQGACGWKLKCGEFHSRGPSGPMNTSRST